MRDGLLLLAGFGLVVVGGALCGTGRWWGFVVGTPVGFWGGYLVATGMEG